MRSNGHGAVITGNSEEVRADSNSSGLLRSWEFGESGGSSSYLFVFLRDVGDGGPGPFGWVPKDNLVIISRGDDLSVVGVKSPDFSFVVRVHDFVIGPTIAWALADSSVAETDHKGTIFAVNCSDEVVE